MLFCYPVAALADNWLHDCVFEMVKDILDARIAGNAMPIWPAVIPPAHRDTLVGRHGLRDRLRIFADAVNGLTVPDCSLILTALTRQNDLPALLGDLNACPKLSDLPVAIRMPATDLFRFAFGLLTALGMRDAHYQATYDGIPAKVCAFCGTEMLDNPAAPRHDLDHLLPISIYPFAGCNLRNLAISGDRCNKSYKKTADPLVDAAGARTVVYDPYGTDFSYVNLDACDFFHRPPVWNTKLSVDDRASTWDRIWSIKSRYETDTLGVEYRNWLDDFAHWFRSDAAGSTDANALDQGLDHYLNNVVRFSFSDRAFLKHAFFSMLKAKMQCADDGPRMSSFLGYLIGDNKGAIASKAP
jgi:hypothetical protein